LVKTLSRPRDFKAQWAAFWPESIIAPKVGPYKLCKLIAKKGKNEFGTGEEGGGKYQKASLNQPSLVMHFVYHAR
jgi:hypothetical protein